MLFDALKNGIDVLKKNKVIFVPFIILGIISILGFLFIAKPMFEFTAYQSYYSSSAFSYPESYNHFFKKFIDIMNLNLIWSIFIFILTILANVAGLKAVRDYLNRQKTKISDMGKTTIKKGSAAIFGVLATSVLFFLPGIIGAILMMFSFSSLPSFSISHPSYSPKIGIIILAAFIMFFIQALILLAFGYYILSKKFRKIYLWGIIITFILFLLILGISGFINPLLSFIFLIPFVVLFAFLAAVLIFITFTVVFLITYILPSAIVLNDMDVINGIKSSLNFVKNNTKNFAFVVFIVIVIQIIILVPTFIISVANSLNPSFSLYVFEEIFSIVLEIIAAPYILSIFALTYASLMKEKSILDKSTQNLSEGGLGRI